MTEYDDTYYDADYDANDYAPEGWQFVAGSDGEPLTDQDGDYYLRNSETGETLVYDPVSQETFETDVDFDLAAANAVQQILEDHPDALDILAEAERVAEQLEAGELDDDQAPAAAPVNTEPSPDQSYKPSTSREPALGEAIDQGIDEILSGNNT